MKLTENAHRHREMVVRQFDKVLCDVKVFVLQKAPFSVIFMQNECFWGPKMLWQRIKIRGEPFKHDRNVLEVD